MKAPERILIISDGQKNRTVHINTESLTNSQLINKLSQKQVSDD